MKEYELMLIMKPDLDDAAQKEIIEKIRNTITTNEGKVLSDKIMGKKELATEINKLKYGIYALYRYEGSGKTNDALTAFFKISETVFRHIIIDVDSIESKKVTEQVKG
jgi:small subunit ribosomal protein S6